MADNIRVRTGSRIHVIRHPGEYEPDEEQEIPTVEILVNGIIFRTDANSTAHAMKMAQETIAVLVAFRDCEDVEIVDHSKKIGEN